MRADDRHDGMNAPLTNWIERGQATHNMYMHTWLRGGRSRAGEAETHLQPVAVARLGAHGARQQLFLSER